MFIQSDLSPLSTYVLQRICLFYVVVNCPPNVLRQQRAVIPVTSGAPVTMTSGASGVPVTSVTPVTTAGMKLSQGKHRGEERYVYTCLAK